MTDPALELRRAATLEDVHRVLRTAARRLTRADGATSTLHTATEAEVQAHQTPATAAAPALARFPDGIPSRDFTA
ncbi:hypothetical protein ACQPW3_35185 [Actinosynnema sp. CA-248983]